jgi:hypothetical protein
MDEFIVVGVSLLFNWNHGSEADSSFNKFWANQDFKAKKNSKLSESAKSRISKGHLRYPSVTIPCGLRLMSIHPTQNPHSKSGTRENPNRPNLRNILFFLTHGWQLHTVLDRWWSFTLLTLEGDLLIDKYYSLRQFTSWSLHVVGIAPGAEGDQMPKMTMCKLFQFDARRRKDHGFPLLYKLPIWDYSRWYILIPSHG